MKAFTRVLLVDDENIFRNRLRNMLSWEEEGFLLVGFAENGKQAISLLDATQPQIVITDIAMPIMDGIELLKEIQRKNELPKNREQPIRTIVISGFDTFSYVRSAMKEGAFDYILKSELTPDILLQRINSLVDNNLYTNNSAQLDLAQFSENLLSGTYTSVPFVENYFKDYGISLNPANPLFLLKSFSADKTELPLQSAAAYQIFNQQLQTLPVVAFIQADCCIIFGEMSCCDNAIALVKNLPEECSSLYWGIQKNIKDISMLPSSKVDLLKIPSYYFYAPSRAIFECGMVSFSNIIPEPISPAAIENAVLKFDYLQISSLFGASLKACNSHKADPYAVRKNCEHAIYLLILAVEKAGGNSSSLSQKKLAYFQSIDAASSIDELCDVLENILSDITAWDNPPTENDQALLYQIENFIAENYMHQIRLSDLAEHVHLSYYYLSRILKSTYGETFNDYLNETRIKAAQELLIFTDKPLNQITEDVGFSDQSYFGKIFKKFTGVSPRNYRLQNS